MPTYGMAKTTYWRFMLELIPRPWIRTVNKSDLQLELVNGSIIALKGANNPDTLRGPMTGLDFVLLDEYSESSEDLWPVIGPQVTDTGGRLLVQGTPKGYNHFHEVWSYGADGLDGWQSYQYTTIEGGNVPLSEIEFARQTMSPKHFRQEFEASFESMTSRIYPDFDPKYNVTNEAAYKGGTIYIGLDFNVSKMCAAICVKDGDTLKIIDEIVLPDSNTREMTGEINNRYRSITNDIVVIPDSSGSARKTSADGNTDFTILKEGGLKVYDMRSNPNVADRINEVNAMILSAANTRRLLVNPACKEVIRCLTRQTYKQGTNVPDKESGLDHMNDSVGYVVHTLFPITANTTRSQRIGL